MAVRHDMRAWTTETEAYLKEGWDIFNIYELATLLHRSSKAIEVKAKKMGLPRKHYNERIYTKKTGRPRK